MSAHLDKGRERLWVDESLRSSWEPNDADAAAWLEGEDRNIIAAIEYDARHGQGRYAWTFVDLLAGVMFRRRDVTGLLVATDAGLEAARRRGGAAIGVPKVAGCGGAPGSAWERRRTSSARGRSFTRPARGGRRRRRCAVYRSPTPTPGGRRRRGGTPSGHWRSTGRTVTGTVRRRRSTAWWWSPPVRPISPPRRRSPRCPSPCSGRSAIGDTSRWGWSNVADLNVEFSAACADEAIAVARKIGDAHVETIALANAALALDHLGAPQEAHQRATAAVARARELGHHFAEAVALDALATTSRRLGNGDVDDCRSLAIERVHEAGDLFTETEILIGAARDAYEHATATARPAHHTFASARADAQRALDAASAAGSPHGQAEALCLLAACDLGLGDLPAALAGARQAIERHAASGARLAEAQARGVHAQALLRNGDQIAAETEWQAARCIVDELALPAAAPIRRLLDRPLVPSSVSLLA